MYVWSARCIKQSVFLLEKELALSTCQTVLKCSVTIVLKIKIFWSRKIKTNLGIYWNFSQRNTRVHMFQHIKAVVCLYRTWTRFSSSMCVLWPTGCHLGEESMAAMVGGVANGCEGALLVSGSGWVDWYCWKLLYSSFMRVYSCSSSWQPINWITEMLKVYSVFGISLVQFGWT